MERRENRRLGVWNDGRLGDWERNAAFLAFFQKYVILFALSVYSFILILADYIFLPEFSLPCEIGFQHLKFSRILFYNYLGKILRK